MYERVNNCNTMAELEELRMPIVSEFQKMSLDDIKTLQKAFVKRKNKIKRHGGVIKKTESE